MTPIIELDEKPSLCYTSGTNSKSKGVLYTHRSCLHAFELFKDVPHMVQKIVFTQQYVSCKCMGYLYAALDGSKIYFLQIDGESLTG